MLLTPQNVTEHELKLNDNKHDFDRFTSEYIKHLIVPDKKIKYI